MTPNIVPDIATAGEAPIPTIGGALLTPADLTQQKNNLILPLASARSVWLYNRTAQTLYLQFLPAGGVNPLVLLAEPMTRHQWGFQSAMSQVTVSTLAGGTGSPYGRNWQQEGQPSAGGYILLSTSSDQVTDNVQSITLPAPWYATATATLAGGAAQSNVLGVSIIPSTIVGIELYNLSSGATPPNLTFTIQAQQDRNHPTNIVGGYVDSSSSGIILLPGMAESMDTPLPPLAFPLIGVTNGSASVAASYQVKVRGY